MTPKLFCQSCTMPIDNEADRGTEKDGSKNSEYCKYCFTDGALIDPGMTIEQMKDIITTQMHKMNIPESIIQHSLHTLPGLKRWRKEAV